MNASVPFAPARRPVRIPFRILAGFVGIAGMMAILSAPFLAWRGIHPMTLGDIIMFPGMVAFTALMFHAALHGGRHEFAKRVEGRPLARNVWNFYVLVLLAYWIFK